MNNQHIPHELKPYLREPPAMEAGAVGKHGKLLLEFTLNKTTGRSYMSNWMRQTPLIVQQELYFDEMMPEMPCVYILSSGGPNVDGDRYNIDIKLNKGAFAHISTGAATKIAEMQYNHAANCQQLTLDEDCYLEYIPLPIIPCKNSRYINNTTITIHPSATLFYSEIYTAGREFYNNGELFQYNLLSINTQGYSPNGELLFRERMVIEPKRDICKKIGLISLFNHFADILILTPQQNIQPLVEQYKPYISSDYALGINYLPEECGINIKILSNSVEELKKRVRTICSSLRKQIKGCELPKEFAWR